VYANLCNGSVGLIAFNGVTGAPLWSYGAPECNEAPAAIAGNRVYFRAADNKIHALNAATGQELWSTAWGASSSVSLANGVMYLSGAIHAPAARAYDATTGRLLWSTPVHAAKYRPPPVAVNGILYVANGACGTICAFNPPAGSASQPLHH
jgi:outer membrane protein assembly factor BamB